MKHNGAIGLFFPEEQSAVILMRLEAADRMEDVIEKQDDLIAALRDRVQTSTTIIEAQKLLLTATSSYAVDLKVAGENLQKERNAAIADLDIWYRQPTVLIGGGFAAGLIVSLLLAVAVK
jgi:flagellar biosynthesis regulator FlaF